MNSSIPSAPSIRCFLNYSSSTRSLSSILSSRSLPSAALISSHKLLLQMFIIVLDGRNAEQYARIKKSADCRLDVVSQCKQGRYLIKSAAIPHKCLHEDQSKDGWHDLLSFLSRSFHIAHGAFPRPWTNHLFQKCKTPQFFVPNMIINAYVTHPAPASAA